VKHIGVKAADRLSGIPKGTLIGEKNFKKKEQKQKNHKKNKEADFSTRELGQPTSTI